MILEVAPLHVRARQESEFETRFLQAQRIISSMPGASSADHVVAGGTGGTRQDTRRNEPRA